MLPILRAIVHVVVMVLVDVAVLAMAGAVLLLACAAWQLLTEHAP